MPVTARGSGSGLSGAARPREGGLLISFERMNAVLEVDTTNQVAVVQPGVTLHELDAATADSGLRYMVHPGELSSSVGGNVGTNAGGMRAVKYGVARHNVLGLQAVLPTGEIIRTGGKIAKVSTGYDLTQLIVGSEGTLALATEVIVKLHPRLDHSATVLAPFADFDQVMEAVPKVLAAGLTPYILEYIDNMTMAALIHTQNLELGIPDQIRDSCEAYLVVALESRTADRLDEDVEKTGELLADLGAVDAYVLEGASARKLIDAREKAFWTLKAVGADDLIDTVVPRGAMPKFISAARGSGGVRRRRRGGLRACRRRQRAPGDPVQGPGEEAQADHRHLGAGNGIGRGDLRRAWPRPRQDPVLPRTRGPGQGCFDAAHQGQFRPGRHPQPRCGLRGGITSVIVAVGTHMPKCVRRTASTASGEPVTSTCAAAWRPKRYRRSSPGDALSKAVGSPGRTVTRALVPAHSISSPQPTRRLR